MAPLPNPYPTGYRIPHQEGVIYPLTHIEKEPQKVRQPNKEAVDPQKGPYHPKLKSGPYKTFFKLAYLARLPKGCIYTDPHVAEMLGIHPKTYKKHREDLAENGYINAKLVPGLWVWQITIPLRIRNLLKGRVFEATLKSKTFHHSLEQNALKRVYRDNTNTPPVDKINLFETTTFKKLERFLEEQESVRNPRAFLMAIVREYGLEVLPKLLEVDFHSWQEYLKRWKAEETEKKESKEEPEKKKPFIPSKEWCEKIKDRTPWMREDMKRRREGKNSAGL